MLQFLDRLRALKALLSPLAAFFAGTFIMYIANGLNSSILAVRLNAENTPTFYTGLVLSCYYLYCFFADLFAHHQQSRTCACLCRIHFHFVLTGFAAHFFAGAVVLGNFAVRRRLLPGRGAYVY